MNETDEMQAEQSKQEHDYGLRDKLSEWLPIPFDKMLWHELIARVNAGTATFDDAQHVRHHLGLGTVASRISMRGGDADGAKEIQANLGVVRKLSLAKRGFTQRANKR